MLPLSKWNKDFSGWGVNYCKNFFTTSGPVQTTRQNQNRKFFTQVKVWFSVLRMSKMDVDWFINSLKRFKIMARIYGSDYNGGK